MKIFKIAIFINLSFVVGVKLPFGVGLPLIGTQAAEFLLRQQQSGGRVDLTQIPL